MKISYQRGMQKNFMIIDPQGSDWDGYDCRMLLSNNIEGLLKMRIRPTEEGPRLYYDITSRQPLDRMMKGAQWKAEEFRTFMIQICGTLTRMERYLLKESCILLDPEYIYMEPGSRRLFFCYVPGLERSFPEGLGKLLEGLLECVDHRDKECVVLAYGLYQETRKENYGTEDLLRQIYSVTVPDESGQEPVEYDLETEEFPVRDVPVREEKAPGFFEKLKDRVFTHFSGTDDDEDDEGELWFDGLREPEEEEKLMTKENVPAFVSETAAEYSGKEASALSAGDTMILDDLRSKTALRILRALDPGVEDIALPYFPFVIGKQDNMVDHRIDDETVSRLHLKILKKEERYVIEDLNSTNGTTLNGELLENNGEREIVTGDVVGIARLRFRFE